MKNLNTFLILIFLITFLISIASADSPALKIADKFILAVQSKDKNRINEAIEELNGNAEAQNILKNNWPNHYALFNLSQLSTRIKNLKRRLGLPSTPVTTPVISSNKSKGLSSNRNLAFIREIPNQILARQNTFISNDKIVRQFPIQKEENNQERIKRRR